MDRFNGKKIVIFAHSMGTANGGAAGQGIPESKTYGGLLRDLNNCVIYRDAIPGARISAPSTWATRMTNPSRWNNLDSVIVPDIIILDAMINDFLQNVELGLPTDTEINTFYGATDYLLKNMIVRYPNTRIAFKLACHTSYQTPEFPEKNTAGVYLTDFIKAAKEVCSRYGVFLIDSFQNSGMTHANTSTYTIDGIHHNELGARTEYETIRNAFNTMLTNEYVDNTNEEEEPPTSSVVFDIKSNNIANVTYNETTNVLESQTNSGNYDFALTDDLTSAVVMMPVANPVGLPAFVIGNDAQGNAVVLYTDGSGKISSFKKSGIVSEITTITILDGLKPVAPKGTPVTITHTTDHVNISYGSYSRDIPYSLIPDLTVKSIGCLFTGNGVSNYIIDKIN